MKVVNEPHQDNNHGARIREFARFLGADELDFESGYDSIIIKKGGKAFRLSADSVQGYEFIRAERLS